MSDVQIIHQLFSQMGIRMKRSTTTNLPGCKDQKVHCYSLDLEVWAETAAILSRRQAKRERLEALSTAKENSIHPPAEDHFNEGGGYSETSDAWLSADNLAEVRSMLELAGDDAVVIANIREAIPGYVLERVRAMA